MLRIAEDHAGRRGVARADSEVRGCPQRAATRDGGQTHAPDVAPVESRERCQNDPLTRRKQVCEIVTALLEDPDTTMAVRGHHAVANAARRYIEAPPIRTA